MNKKQDIKVDFLGIGVQKSASSWLWSLLKEHDAVWMPPRKELHYFDRSLDYPSPSFLASDNLKERLNDQKPHNILFRQKLEEELSRQVSSSDENREWYLNYFLGTYSDAWYQSLFEQGKGKIKGEITPAYSILNKKDIEHIHTLFPNLKIILILRDPIERAWSQARFYMTRNKFEVDSNLDEIKKFIDSDIQVTRGDYVSILRNWSSVFSEEKLFIGFYDEVSNTTEEFVVKICKFLEIENIYLNKSQLLNKKVNVSIKIEMPKEIEKYLVTKYLDDMKYLSDLFASYPKRWFEKYENILLV